MACKEWEMMVWMAETEGFEVVVGLRSNKE